MCIAYYTDLPAMRLGRCRMPPWGKSSMYTAMKRRKLIPGVALGRREL